MSDLTLYNFEQMPVRVLMRDGDPWFLAADIAQLLGYRDAHNAVRSLDDDEKGAHIVSTLGGDQQQIIISESGLYAAILKSRRPEAKRFRRWVTGEVLPAIRRTGRYDGPQAAQMGVGERIRAYLAARDQVRLEQLCRDLGLGSDNDTKQAIVAVMRAAGWRKTWVAPQAANRPAQMRRVGP